MKMMDAQFSYQSGTAWATGLNLLSELTVRQELVMDDGD